MGIILNISSLKNALAQFKINYIHQKGDTDYFHLGKNKKSVTGKPFETSSLDISYGTEDSLINLLSQLLNIQNVLKDTEVEEITIWALMERVDQINGELSFEEIAKMKDLNASFCWSVIYSESE